MDLIIGNGLIGRNLSYRLRDAVLLSRKDLDLSKNDWDLPECDKVYICAGETSTQKCEDYPEETRRVNVEGTIKLAERLGDNVVFISSERVFDGTKSHRTVNDEVSPVTEYGRQKAEVEKILLEMGCTVIRFSKVLGWDVPLFNGWIKNLKLGGEIYPYSNMSMSPLPVQLVAEIIEKADKGLSQASALDDLIYDRIAYFICNYMGADMNSVRPVEASVGHINTSLESNVDCDLPDSWDVIYKWCKNGLLGRTR